MNIRAFVIDDEPLARQRVKLLARDEPGLEIIGEFGNGPDALPAIQETMPDLLFLDVQMPEMDGFELLKRLPTAQLPCVIFTTAYDRHAIQAFEAHALDYLLKPFKPERFHTAVARARQHLADRQASAAARGLLDLLAARAPSTNPASSALPAPSTTPADAPPTPPHAPPQRLTRLTIRNGDKVLVLKTSEIDSIESAGNYVAVQTGAESHILRETLSSLEEQLDPEKFLRVSRSAIVNLDRVRELQPMFKGEHIIVMANGKRISMTRGLREVEHALRFG